ncbi:hypothetical protein ABID08_004992 [Rhizobium binae]|uniref:BrnT family toxin n=1 Tax=Rhizobium binae TaxID=1138190 RepID=A0ABV2MMD0_9HYPH|nr:DUF6522 family protein [Rhizobium binae]MBX4994502.1 hypothetical protein [Rhizobium binae]NKL50412.1 hypothetical protein [Rhizobium leguminosarum bv. viciae]
MFSAGSDDSHLLETDDIADRFGLTVQDFKRYRNLGLIVVVAETGSNEHEGLTRLTCRFGNRVWQAVVGGDKRIVHEEIRYLRGKLSRPSNS